MEHQGFLCSRGLSCRSGRYELFAVWADYIIFFSRTKLAFLFFFLFFFLIKTFWWCSVLFSSIFMHKKNKMAQPISIMSFFFCLTLLSVSSFFFCLLWNPVPFFFFCLWTSQFWNGLDTLILSLHPVRKMAQWCEHSPHEPCGCCMHVLSVVPVWAEADSWTRGGINYIVTYSWPGWPSHNAGGCEASGCYLPGTTEWVSVGHEMRMVNTAQRVDLVNVCGWTEHKILERMALFCVLLLCAEILYR